MSAIASGVIIRVPDVSGPRRGRRPGTSGEMLPEVYDELRKLARARLARERQRESDAAADSARPRSVSARLRRSAAQAVGSARPFLRRRGVGDAAHPRGARPPLSAHQARRRRGTVELDSAMLRADPALDRSRRRRRGADAASSNAIPRKAQIVSLRYFAGLSVEETAAALDLSPATVKNEWAFARAWLYRALGPIVRGQRDGRSRVTCCPTPRQSFSRWPRSILPTGRRSSTHGAATTPLLRRQVEALLATLDAPRRRLSRSGDGFPTLDMNAVDGPLQPGTRLGEFLVLHGDRLRRHGRRVRRATGSAAADRRDQGAAARFSSPRDPQAVRARGRSARPAAASRHRTGLYVSSAATARRRRIS